MCVACGCSNSTFSLAPPVQHTRRDGARTLSVEEAVLAENDRYARINRKLLAARGITALNFLSSPGSGKTTLLVNTIKALASRYSIGVIEGDQQTDRDAARIRETGAAAVQINTGKGCHLDALMVGRSFDQLGLHDDGLLFIENVGNLVCPAEFDLGESAKVVILSVTEGEDKPLKYPNMFHAADVVLINKIDLLPHLTFDMTQCREYIKRVNSRAPIISVSATHGEGMTQWLEWIEASHRAKSLDPSLASPGDRQIGGTT